jgi:two-component system KDP operon response regulator KdpE
MEICPMPANPPLVLLVDASPQRRSTLAAGLAEHHFAAAETASAVEALERLEGERFDAILLNLDLPAADALDLITTLRRRSLVPILALTARPSEASLIDAFGRGADDYVAMPANLAKLVARLRAALRHRFRARDAAPIRHYGDISVDPMNRRVQHAGRDVKLSPIEYQILTLLTEHAGKTLTHDYLLRRVWGPNKINDIQYLRVYMRSLRQKLVSPEAQRDVIRTESGIGYRFVPADHSTHSCQPAA